MTETMQASQKDGHFNESIVNEEILEDMKKNRIDHMKYLPDMEQLEESDVMDQVISAMKAYDYDKYIEADVRRAEYPIHTTSAAATTATAHLRSLFAIFSLRMIFFLFAFSSLYLSTFAWLIIQMLLVYVRFSYCSTSHAFVQPDFTIKA